jgi:hypothetical protein
MASTFSWWWSLPSCSLCKPLDFTRNNIHLQVSVEVIISNVPGYIDHVPEYFVLESLYNIYIALLGATPELDTVCPYGFWYMFQVHLFSFLTESCMIILLMTFFHVHTVHLDNYQSFFTNWCTIVHQLVKKHWYLLTPLCKVVLIVAVLSILRFKEHRVV